MMQEEFSHTVLHRNRAAASSQVAKTRAGAAERRHKSRAAERPGATMKRLPARPQWRVPLRGSTPAHYRPPHQRAAEREAAAQQKERLNGRQPLGHYRHLYAQLDAFQRRNTEDVLPPPPPLPPPPLQEREQERCEEHPALPYQLVAAARDEYLQRRHEANQYKLRAEKQLGLRPCTAERNRKPSGQEQEVGQPEHQHAPQDRRQEGQQEYLRQLDAIRQQYHQEMRQMRLRAEVQQPQHKQGTFVVEKPRDPEPSLDSEEQQGAPPAQDVEAALRKIREENKEQRRALERKHKDKKGIMFEIRLDEEGMKGDGEKEKEKGREEEEKKEGDGRQTEEEEVDPLNQTLSFQEGEELKLRDWSEERRGWSQRTPQTLLDALANMDVHSVYNTAAVGAERGVEVAGHRQWVDGPPNTLLNALAQAELTSSTLDSETTEAEKDRAEEEEEDSDVEMDEERLEPRSDDDDTNFEESEDELREAVADSMNNLFVMEDESSDEAERTEERVVAALASDGTEENEGGGAESAADSPQIQQQEADVVSSEPAERDAQTESSDDHTTKVKAN
ncbi:serine/threonine-protein kinase Nek5-like [Perca flavescens]|uniref:serine/threonine-protein kinase Nek5-like n=1 Tax=Perca flavescens TaxID=8167 RepID=UPI00106E3CF5|nr:serine/threonine-protein kinase Nek5-like [Perca flavescens]